MLNRHRPSPSSWHHTVLTAALIVGAIWVVLCTLPNDVQAQNQNRFRKPGESPWFFAGNMGVPSFDFDDTNIDWDLAVGYFGDSFIASFDMGQTLIDKIDGPVETTIDVFRNNFTVGWRRGAPDTFRHALLLQSQILLTAETFIVNDTEGFGFDLTLNDNTTGRTALVYGYYSPDSPSTSWALFGGVGAAFKSSNVDAGSLEGTSNDSDETFLLARGEGQHVWLPGWVTVTGRSELRIYSATRTTFDFDQGLVFEDASGVALDTRAVVKVDNFDVFDLHPMAYAELDLDISSAASGADFIVAPAIGIGITR